MHGMWDNTERSVTQADWQAMSRELYLGKAFSWKGYDILASWADKVMTVPGSTRKGSVELVD